VPPATAKAGVSGDSGTVRRSVTVGNRTGLLSAEPYVDRSDLPR
jgi:hypothetical protein